MQNNSPSHRKLRLSPLQSIAKPQPAPPVPPPACVAPRRRFELIFLAICATFTQIGLTIAFARCVLCIGESWLTMAPFLLIPYLPTAILCIPARTRRGTLLQLLGLLCPLLIALISCTLCWGQPHSYGYGMAFVMAVGIPAIFGPLYVFLPVWILHLILCIMDKRRYNKKLIRS